MTTFQGKPPSFSVVEIDPDTMLPTEFLTYAFDLDHANQFDEPIWKLKYNYTSTYNLSDLSPSSMYGLSNRIFYDEATAKTYKSHRFIDGPGNDPSDGCDFECRMIMYCQTVSSDYDEYQFCHDRNFYNAKNIA